VASAVDRLQIPAGWRTGPPDYVGIGAQKAGTTWWFWLIESHPDVHRDARHWRELHFFDRLHDRWLSPSDIAAYHGLFPRPEGQLVGEKTPEYMAIHWTARMLHEAAPETRLIALLRDPVERFVSGVTHTRDRVHRLAPRSNGGHRHDADYRQDRRIVDESFQLGMYAEQLRRFLDHFPREQLLVLQYERCVGDTAAQLARTYDFLGLRPHSVPEEDLRDVRNATRVDKYPLEPERRRLLVDLYAQQVEELITLVPDLDVALWPNFAHLAAPAPRSGVAAGVQSAR
jgi:hypothetical protein